MLSIKKKINLTIDYSASTKDAAQQVSQRDAPPVGGFEVWFFNQGSVASLKSSEAARPLP